MPRLAKVEREVKHLLGGGEIKATNDAQGIIEGYLNYIGNIDYGDDRTMKGAFQQTLKDSYARKSRQDLDFLWPYLWNHDYSSDVPPGGIFEADETKKGLYIKAQLNLDIETGQKIYSSFKKKTLSKQSMGYKAIQVDWVKEDGRPIRNLLEVAVMEGSAVVFPMNDLAQVDTVKNGRRNFYMPGKLLTKQEYPAITKDYAASYAATTQMDWVSDLWNLWYPLRNEIIVAFQTGDTPVEDVQTAVKQFSAALIAYVQRGVELDMTGYLQPDDDDTAPNPMYMSADDNPETKDTKEGRMISAANHAKLTKAAEGIDGHVKVMKDVLKSAAQRQNTIAGTPLYSSADDPTPEQKQDEKPPVQKDEFVEDVHSGLHDLTLLLSADNANRAL